MTVVEDRFAWFPGPVPDGVTVAQVYGWLVDDHGRVLIQPTPEGFNLPGGSPEPHDGSLAQTLAREAMEESQVVVKSMVVLGHERSTAPGASDGYVRAAARIADVLERRPDPDGGRLLGRLVVAWPTAVDLLGWGRAGAEQARAAVAVAEGRWGLPVHAPRAADAELF
jgi:8-oxo-dGTP diphosphatase